MNKKHIITFAVCAFFLSAAPQVQALETEKEKISYILGADITQTIIPIREEIDIEQFIQGIRDQFSGAELQISLEEARPIMQAFSTRMQKKAAEQTQMLGEKNMTEGKAFLAENKEKEGVVTTASGLQYMIITEGKGDKPKATDKVKVNYRGTTIDGNEFDSSYKRGQPAVFPVNQVIKGWTEALQLMPVGSKYKLFIPSELAYGERGAGNSIAPNSVLIFEVELLGIEK